MYKSKAPRRLAAVGISMLAWSALAAPSHVPPREDNSFARQSSTALWTQIRRTGSVAVVGLKAPGQNRGIWKGKLLLSSEERAKAEQFLRDSPDVEVLWSDPKLPLVHVRFESPDALARHRGLAHVDYVQPAGGDIGFFSTGCGTDIWGSKPVPGPLEYHSTQYPDVIPWNFKSHRIPEAWKRGNAGAGVKIGVTDTGVYPGQSQLWSDWDIRGPASRRFNYTHNRTIDHFQTIDRSVYKTQEVYDDCNHGTRIAGTVGAPLDGQNIVGVAYRADLVSVRINPGVVAFGEGMVENARLGVRMAVEEGAKIVEMAWGTFLDQPALQDEIEDLYDEYDVLFVGAAGTGGWGLNFPFVVSPAKYDEVIAVTGVNAGTMDIHTDAFYGPEVDVAIEIGETPAPGAAAHDLLHFGGTSNASAVVSGILGLIWSKYPHMTRDQVRDRLYWSAHNNGKPDVGHGKIDAYKALGGFMSLSMSGPTNVESGTSFTLHATAEGEGPFKYYWNTGTCSTSCMLDASCWTQCSYNTAPCVDGAHPTCKAISRYESQETTAFSNVLVIDQTDGSRKVANKVTHVDCTPYDPCTEYTCGNMRNNCGVQVSCGGCGPGELCMSNACIGREEP